VIVVQNTAGRKALGEDAKWHAGGEKKNHDSTPKPSMQDDYKKKKKKLGCFRDDLGTTEWL